MNKAIAISQFVRISPRKARLAAGLSVDWLLIRRLYNSNIAS